MATDFKSALERAKAVAAKLSGTTPAPTGTNYSATINNGNSNGNSLKRNLDDDDTIVGNLKKMAYSNTSLDDNNLSNSLNQNQQQRSNNGNTFFKPSSVYLDGVIINGEKTLDIMIPGNKVGFIIGKGGEMIRQLQERASVKMTIIQQSSEVTDSQKQLRIVGDTSKVDYAQQLVKELLVEKEMELLKYKNKPNPSNEYGSIPQNYIEIPVSPQYIGLVIGKGGENIKRISQETGAKVAVDTSKTDSNGNKLCQISALNLNAVNTAADMVKEILDNAMNNKRVPAPGSEEVKISVPQNKTGIVIGKGGETIRSIKQQCGCNIELEKNSKGIFIIRGPADRIQYAQQLIGEKVGTQVTVLSSTMQNSQGSNYSDQYWAAASQAQFSGYPQDPTASSSVSNNQDNSTAAWAAYYAQYYSQIQMGQQLPVDANAPNPAAAMNPSNPPNSQMPMSAPVGSADQDYSAQWAEWYRFYGMEKEAEMVEQMAKKKNSSYSKK